MTAAEALNASMGGRMRRGYLSERKIRQRILRATKVGQRGVLGKTFFDGGNSKEVVIDGDLKELLLKEGYKIDNLKEFEFDDEFFYTFDQIRW